MEPNGVLKESVKGHTIRFFKWNQMFTAMVLNGLLQGFGWGVIVFHTKNFTFQSSGVFHSTENYMTFPLCTTNFFSHRRSAEYFLRQQMKKMKFTLDTTQILVKDICDYIFGCFKFEPNMFQLARRVPVIVSDIYLTRQKGDEDLAHVDKQRKVSYMCGFTDIDDAIKKYICKSKFFKPSKEEVQTRNKGLLRICPAVKEKNSRSKTNDSSCPICFEGYEKGEQLMVGPCSHMFHRACLLKWLPGPCPICRGGLTREFRM